MSKDKEELQEEAEQRIVREISEESTCREYFKPYKDESVKSFIGRYAEAKATLEVYGDFTRYRQENIIADYHKGAWNALKEIQLKKLFDVECQWRAEEVTGVPDVLVTRDFDRIAENILLYDGISPISELDIELYQQFLHQRQTQVFYHLNATFFYDFEELKEGFLSEPEADNYYFDFHNQNTASGELLNLPDIRSIKEEKYVNAFRVHKSSKSESGKTPKPKPQPANQKQHLSAFDPDMIRFGEFIGDKRTLSFIRDRQRWMEVQPDHIFHWAFIYLSDIAPEKVPIEANNDWKEGLYFTAVHHRNRRVSALLPTIHEEYLMKREMGLLVPEKEPGTKVDFSEIWKKYILDGREILGEPRDFNY